MSTTIPGMAVRTDILLDKSAEHIAGIRTMYATLVSEVAVTDDLLYLVRSAIQDQLSALDWIATAVDQQHGKAEDRSPYFPLRDAPQAFTKQFDRNFALVATSLTEQL